MFQLNTISHIELEISSHCNSKCPQCPRYDMQGNVQPGINVKHLEKKILFDLPITQMINLKTIELCGYFGDPLMHPELDEIINFFYQKKILISTNASLRNISWWKTLGQKKNIIVKFCIDGIGKTHELYRRNTSYEKIIENAKSFIKSGGHARWQFIIFKHNEHQIEQARELSEKMGFEKIDFIYSNRFDSSNTWKVYEKGKHLYNLEKASNQITLRERTATPEGTKYWRNLFLSRSKEPISCIWSEEKKIYIHSDATVFPCCYIINVLANRPIEKKLYEKIIKDWKNINLNFYKFEDIISGPFYRKYFLESLKNSPHPVCIDTCDKNNGKLTVKQNDSKYLT
jgi:MoaA/NifB/PqqE/SkfB family radical SAM enzyme